MSSLYSIPSGHEQLNIEKINPDSSVKRGLLLEPFRIFKLNSIEFEPIPSHFHEFHKVTLFLGGRVRYVVEGKSYELREHDLLLIPSHAIHQPIIDRDITYNRYVLWISPDAIVHKGLDSCFIRCSNTGDYLVGRRDYDHLRIRKLFEELASASAGKEYGDDILAGSLCDQILVYLCRTGSGTYSESDPLIDSVIKHINANLSEDLSADRLASAFFISKSRLMHKFSYITGCSLHRYISQKRLIYASELLSRGLSATEAASASGFSDYSTFFRAYVAAYGTAPGRYKRDARA